jgi:hypothetical protein
MKRAGRLTPELAKAVEAYVKRGKLSRNGALRQLVERGLERPAAP